VGVTAGTVRRRRVHDGVVALLSLDGHFNAASVIALPTLAVFALAISLWRASRAAGK